MHYYFSIDELKIGMKVYKEQLSNIYDTWIILYRPKDMIMDEDGFVGFIGSEPTDDSDLLYNSNNIITPIYNDSIVLEGDIYEE